MKMVYIAPESEVINFVSAENLASDWLAWANEDGGGYAPDNGGSNFGVDILPDTDGENTPTMDPDGDL